MFHQWKLKDFLKCEKVILTKTRRIAWTLHKTLSVQSGWVRRINIFHLLISKWKSDTEKQIRKHTNNTARVPTFSTSDLTGSKSISSFKSLNKHSLWKWTEIIFFHMIGTTQRTNMYKVNEKKNPWNCKTQIASALYKVLAPNLEL